MSHAQIGWTEPRPCTGCKHFRGLLFGNTAADCRHNGGRIVHAMWRTGCAFWDATVIKTEQDPRPQPPDHF